MRLKDLLRAAALLCVALYGAPALAKSVAVKSSDFMAFTVNSSKYDKTLSGATTLRVNAAALRPALAKATELTISDFPISADGLTGSLELKRTHSVVDGRTKFVTQTALGELELDAPFVECFAGTVQGDASSNAFLVCSGDMLFAMVRRGEETTLISPKTNKSNTGEHLLVSERSLAEVSPFKFTCGLEDEGALLAKSFEPPKTLSTALLETELAVETDTYFYNATGKSLNKAQSYVAALYALMSAVYEKELNICFRLTWVKIWTDSPADPYNSGGLWIPLKDAAVPYWDSHYQNVERDLAQVVTADPSGVGQGGWGALNTVCRKGNSAGMSFISIKGFEPLPTFAFTYDVYTAAHEIGHNFGSVHTHHCFWNPPIDTCFVSEDNAECVPQGQQRIPNPGSIMSYCVVANNEAYGKYECNMTFLQKPGQVIRANAEAAACLEQPAAPMVSLLSPNGEEKFSPGDKISITWVSARVNAIKIDYSLDGGATWTEIKDVVQAGVKKFDWTAPDVCGKVRMRISDASNASVSDASIKDFSIIKISPEGLVAYYPFNGNANDETCRLNDATLNGGATFAADRFGVANKAVKLDGASDLKVGTFDRNGADFSVSLWFSVDELTSAFQTLAAQDYAAGGSFQIIIQNGNLAGAGWVDGVGVPPVAWSGNIIQPAKWYHAVATYSASTLKVYVDGSQVATVALPGPIKNSLAALQFGMRGAAEAFKGKIDDIKIFNRELTPADIQTLYNEIGVAPGKAELTAPANNAIDQKLELEIEWKTVQYAEKYHAQVATSQEFNAGSIKLESPELTSTKANITNLSFDTKYYWRVAAINSKGQGEWSDVFSFTTQSDVSANDNPAGNLFNSAIYPNPAESSAVIRLSYVPADLKITVINDLGETLPVDHEISENGATLNLSSLPSGCYYYKLQSGNRIEIKRFCVVR